MQNIFDTSHKGSKFLVHYVEIPYLNINQEILQNSKPKTSNIVTDDPGSKPDQIYGWRRDRQNYKGRIK